jgi:UDP-N-acetylmuramoyl-tripeptide--D-alanyl-D-alanine ligase
VQPQQKKLVKQAESIFAKHKAIKIAVLGSYGKTTMKELLLTVLSEGKRVSATPGNMNVSVSHARFAQKLRGDEEILIVEFGEGAPGDISRMAKMLQPNYAVVTGLAPNHLDHYASLDAVAKDLLSIYETVDRERVLVAAESSLLGKYLDDAAVKFSSHEALGWKVSNATVNIDSLSFTLTKDGRKMTLASGLVGVHQVAPLALVAGIASELGLSDDEIIRGIAKTKPYEHRMQPRFINGAWLVDDTYNGNLEGVRAGLKYLETVDAKRKWYVTPGLVDQGEETVRVHKMLGEAIIDANPDIVVLMENSVRPILEEMLKSGKFRGEVRIEYDPLSFYTNIEHVIAAGDIVLMQNDWTDNYN